MDRAIRVLVAAVAAILLMLLIASVLMLYMQVRFFAITNEAVLARSAFDYAATLELARALIWPAIFVWFVYAFRPQIRQLFTRLSTLKVAGNELVFQSSLPDAAPANPEAKVEISQIDPNGFFTAEGIRNIVAQSNLLSSSERPAAELLLFVTNAQRTWLVASQSQIVIVLDDEATRADNRLIQLVMHKETVTPLKFRSKGVHLGSVRFGSNPTWWFFSRALFPSDESLEASFEDFLSQSSG
jgi:hypothetical protein